MDLPRLNMDDEQPKMVLMLLPDSLLDHILQYCDSSSLVCTPLRLSAHLPTHVPCCAQRACAAVNKGLSKLANESQLWRQLYFSRWCAVLHRDVQAVLAKNWKRITLTVRVRGGLQQHIWLCCLVVAACYVGHATITLLDFCSLPQRERIETNWEQGVGQKLELTVSSGISWLKLLFWSWSSPILAVD